MLYAAFPAAGMMWVLYARKKGDRNGGWVSSQENLPGCIHSLINVVLVYQLSRES